jgi:phosphate transport system substrate-binding protein
MLLRLCVLLVACQGDDDPPPPPATQPLTSPEPGVLRLMGTGAMTPLAQAWACAFPGVVVEPSVGSGGGVRAAADGAVDLGMISRPLSDEERRLGLEMVPVARDQVVIAAHPTVAFDRLSRAELAAFYAGSRRDAVLLLRDAQESANLALERVLPELTPLREEAYRSGRWRVLYHDDAMEQALAATPGSLGVASSTVTVRLPLKVVSVDGVEALRPLAFVLRPERRARAAAFLAFVASAEGRRITSSSGYLP